MGSSKMQLFKNRKRVVVSAAVILALILAAAPATYSYLTASSGRIVNTFAGGAISLTLDEAKVDGNGQATSDARVTENTYKVMPGVTLDKDPTVTVLAGSEECYVFLYVDDPLAEEYFAIDYSSDWTAIASAGTSTLYVYKSTIDASEEDVELTPIFTQIEVSDSMTSDEIAELGEVSVTIEAYAVQKAAVTLDSAANMAADYFAGTYNVSWGSVDSTAEVVGAYTEDTADSEDAGDEDTSGAEEQTGSDESETGSSADTDESESASSAEDSSSVNSSSSADAVTEQTQESDTGSSGEEISSGDTADQTE